MSWKDKLAELTPPSNDNDGDIMPHDAGFEYVNRVAYIILVLRKICAHVDQVKSHITFKNFRESVLDMH